MAGVSQLLAIKALDGLYLRAIAIAENIANSGSGTFKSHSVDFEAELREAAASGVAAIERYNASISTDGALMQGDEVRLDLEMASASETALRYAALTDILNRQLQISRLAVRGQ
jgi:flagellar basal-body rod protein FlgB